MKVVPVVAVLIAAPAMADTLPVQVTSIFIADPANPTSKVGVSNVSGQKALKVDVIQTVGGGGGGTSSTFGAAFPATGTAIGFTDGTNMQEGRVFDLDTGAGSQYIQGINIRFSGSGGSVEAGTSSNPIRVDPTGTTTQPISAVSLPLPTGAATETTLALILTMSAFQARINTQGQKTMAASTPVVIASDQSPISAIQSGTWNINNISGTISLPTGAATEATLSTRLADSSFTGRINTQGQKTMSASTPVVLASDQSAIPVNTPNTGSAENDGACPSGSANFTVISTNATRKLLFMWASPANTADVYLKLGATATTSDARLAPGQPMNFDSGSVWNGQVDAIPASGTQAVCVVAL